MSFAKVSACSGATSSNEEAGVEKISNEPAANFPEELVGADSDHNFLTFSLQRQRTYSIVAGLFHDGRCVFACTTTPFASHKDTFGVAPSLTQALFGAN